MRGVRNVDYVTMPLQRLLFVIVIFLAVARLQAKVCGNVDIRNSPSQFAKLKDCTVITGNLKIVLIERCIDQDFDNLTFPALREIKEYLMVFKVSCLTTLGKLFPNLSVIHGDVLVRNYALIIFDNPDMKEVSGYRYLNLASFKTCLNLNRFCVWVDSDVAYT